MKYDRRMNPYDNLKYGFVLPLLCWMRGHNFTCYKVVPTSPQEWFYWCHRCMFISDADYLEPCGQCDNGCHDYDWNEDD